MWLTREEATPFLEKATNTGEMRRPLGLFQEGNTRDPVEPFLILVLPKVKRPYGMGEIVDQVTVATYANASSPLDDISMG